MRKLQLDELNRLNIEEFQKSEKLKAVVVLDNIRSMNNVGSAFRTADGLAIEKLVLCGITATPPHKEIHKTALGAQDSMSWEKHENTSKALIKLKEEGYILIALEQTDESTELQNFKYDSNNKYAFIFGNEVFGIEDEALEICDHCIEIPQFGTKHSFNVSVTMGMTLWDFFLKTRG